MQLNASYGIEATPVPAGGHEHRPARRCQRLRGTYVVENENGLLFHSRDSAALPDASGG